MILDATDRVTLKEPDTERYRQLLEACIVRYLKENPNKSEYDARLAFSGEPTHLLKAYLS